MSRFLREPLFHFCLFGLVVYAVHAWVRPPSPRTIVVSAEAVAGLEADFLRQHGRAPDPEEHQRLIDRHVDERVLLAEARGHRLGDGDPIVRRRLVQLMRFVLDSGADREPSDEELRAFWRERPDRYRIPVRVTLEHVFFSTTDGVEEARVALQSGDEPAGFGEPFPHGREVRAATIESLDATFGSGFGASVESAPTGEWVGPIPSSFGQHLVRVGERLPAASDFERVRSRVVADWRIDRQETRVRERLAVLRSAYLVEVAESP